jgi:hypothetical protein
MAVYRLDEIANEARDETGVGPASQNHGAEPLRLVCMDCYVD